MERFNFFIDIFLDYWFLKIRNSSIPTQWEHIHFHEYFYLFKQNVINTNDLINTYYYGDIVMQFCLIIN